VSLLSAPLQKFIYRHVGVIGGIKLKRTNLDRLQSHVPG